MQFKRPPILKPGDKVAIISPSAGLPSIFPWLYNQGLRRIQEIFHLEPIEYPTARQSPEYLSKNKTRLLYPSEGWHWHNSQNHVIRGQLWGGCLEVLDLHLSVKRYLPSFDQLEGVILFIETSEEMPSEGFVYRFITALAELGVLAKFQAILMGYPKAQFCGKQPPEGREAFILNQRNAVKEALKDYQLNIPVIFNLSHFR